MWKNVGLVILSIILVSSAILCVSMMQLLGIRLAITSTLSKDDKAAQCILMGSRSWWWSMLSTSIVMLIGIFLIIVILGGIYRAKKSADTSPSHSHEDWTLLDSEGRPTTKPSP